ncbi:MAG TPA: PLP-dependent aminotransferase family protein [Vicinamibacterales bacterium]|nr:PLP-dependent aminotransferase family protein [Vicinamibacterales bacterium]
MLVRLEGKGRLNQRLFRGLRRAILAGTLAPGSRLPSTRALADDLDVSRNVVLLAFAQLVDEGYAEARGGSGTFVSSTLPDPRLSARAAVAAVAAAGSSPHLSAHARRVVALAPLPAVGRPARPGLLYDFRYGVPAVAEFPQQAWARLAQQRLRAMSIGTLRYGKALGWLPLRKAIAEYVTRTRGVAATFEQVAIVNGSQQALDLVARLLVDAGDRVAIEEPSYISARQVFLAAGADLVSVPVDADGLDVSQLPKRGPVRVAYVTPSHQFPLGGVLPRARRLELLRWAARSDAIVVEDDYDSEFWYGGHPVEAIQGLDAAGRVIYVGTFSKVLFPSLRLGYLIVPPALVAPLAALKFLLDRHAPTFEQEVLAEFIAGGHFERHIRRARARNAARRAVMLEAFRETLGSRVEIVGANAGIHVVAWLHDVPAASLENLIARAADRGVGIYSVAPYYTTPPKTAGLLLGYAGLTEREIRDGIRVLAAVIGRRAARR